MIAEYSISESAISESDDTSALPLTGPLKLRGNPAWTREADIGDVGAYLDKRDSVTEGEEPYAAGWLRYFRGARGSAYTKKSGTLVAAEDMALARFTAAWASRAPERYRANQNPARADEKLEYWAARLGVTVTPLDSKSRIRARCIANNKAARGASLATLRDSIEALLGVAYVSAEFQEGADLDTPPSPTYWPEINPGPAAQDLGNGTWASPRSHLVVTVVQPSGMTEAEFNRLMNAELARFLDDVLPAWCTFEWTT